ncbi:MAG: DnaJ domain-containing protein [Armatimonadota bacterium]|nr:DnaJ domain-containing protein [bacterium]
MRTTRTYYEILGLPRDATLVQIKRRYKQLVRKYHPDVAEDKVMAHRLFIQIQEAYDTLTDPSSRRDYDAKLNSQIPRASSYSSQSASTRQARQEPVGELLGHIRDAQFAFVQRRFHEAANHCKQALQIDPRNARAHVILGDIYRAQGRGNNAVRSYSYALQYNPSDHDTEKKLMDLVGKQAAHASASAHKPVSNTRLAALTMLWWAVAFFLIIMIHVWPGEPIPQLRLLEPYVNLFSWNLIAFMASASVVIGILISINGLVSHPDEELVFDVGSGGWIVVPTGLLLLVGSGFFFLGAAVLYLVMSLVQWSVSRSVLITFACVIGVVTLSSLTYQPDAMKQVLLFGGNVSFLSMLIGWYIGASFKPASR